MKIAIAQCEAEKGDVNKNIEKHQYFINKASEKEAGLILFPELSLTGYEPELADELAFSPDDERLSDIQESANSKHMIIMAGAPIRLETGLHIGLFILLPYQSPLIYTKQHLHGKEKDYFNPGSLDPKIYMDGEVIALSICADINHPQHAEKASKNNSTIYLSSVFITPDTYEKDEQQLIGYARKHSFLIGMSNFVGTSGGLVSAGRSGSWLKDGSSLAKLPDNAEGLIIITSKNNQWSGEGILYND